METNQEVITDIDGEQIVQPTAKQWAVIEIAKAIARDDEMLKRIVSFCEKPGNEHSSFEDILSNKSKFRNMLLRYPEIAKEYNRRKEIERLENVSETRLRLERLRKLRRKQK